MVLITRIEENSPAYGKIKIGEYLVSINSHDIDDVLDYRFFSSEKVLKIELSDNEKIRIVKIKKREDEDLGLGFKTYLMDEKRNCRNKCVFCFIDQMPPKTISIPQLHENPCESLKSLDNPYMRETLYFKDDDARLSFLQGNYITLTNLTEPDVQRIIDMKLSVNVSVHTTNPELRVKMMNNRFAGEALEYLKRMAAAKIHLNCQIVLCKGWNDGRELLNSLLDLNDMKPAVKSVAVVPVGLTKYRENLTQFQPFTPEDAKAVIDITRKFNGVFAADEFYLLAGEEIPPDEYYGDYPQYENGVGMVRYQIRNFEDNIDYIGEEEGLLDLKGIKSFSMAVGTSVAGVMGTFAEKLTEKTNVKVNIFPIKNLFWGESITVSGLITAGDIINQLKDKDLGDFLLLPKTMLNSDNLFLDNLTVEDIEKELNVKVRVQEFLLQE